VKLRVVERWHESGKADEAAKGDDVDQIEIPTVLFKKAIEMLPERLVLDVRWLLGQKYHDAEREQHHRRGKAIYLLPAIVRRQPWSKERCYGRAAVTRAGDTHGEAVQRVAGGSVDVVLFMTAVQVIHLFQVAEEMGLRDALSAGLRSLVVVSIGPTTSEELAHYGITPDFEPSRPKMGFLVNEAAQYSGRILKQKKNESTSITGQTDADKAPPVERAESRPTARVHRVAPSTPTMAGFRDGLTSIDFVHQVSSRIAAADPLHVVLGSIVEFVTTVIPCDSCFIYVLEQGKLVLRASKNPHADLVDRLGVQLGQGITGWVAENREPVAIASNASNDSRFMIFRSLPEDHFEAILCTPILCASKVVGVINLQHRLSYQHTESEVRLLSTLGFLVGAEIERARLETENVQLANRLESRKAVERAKGALQRDLGMSEDEAYRTMQKESRQRRISMQDIAEAILLGEDLKKGRDAVK
jgi:uroporphyrinogen-III synthase